MYFVVKRKENENCLYLVQDVHEGNTCKQKVLKSFGNVEELLAKDPKAIDKLYERYQDLDPQDLEDDLDIAELRQKFLGAKDKKRSKLYILLNYAPCILRQAWRSLQMYDFCSEIKTKDNLHFDLTLLIFYAVLLKLVDPESTLNIADARFKFIGNRIPSCDLEFFDQAVASLDKHRDDLLKHLKNVLGSKDSKYLFVFDTITDSLGKLFLSSSEKYFKEKSPQKFYKQFRENSASDILALIILRFWTLSLVNAKNSKILLTSEIRFGLKNANLLVLKMPHDNLLFMRATDLSLLEVTDFSTLDDVNQKLDNENYTDIMMELNGLTPIPDLADLKTIAQCVKIDFKTSRDVIYDPILNVM